MHNQKLGSIVVNYKGSRENLLSIQRTSILNERNEDDYRLLAVTTDIRCQEKFIHLTPKKSNEFLQQYTSIYGRSEFTLKNCYPKTPSEMTSKNIKIMGKKITGKNGGKKGQ